jgi:hypothetical protein
MYIRLAATIPFLLVSTLVQAGGLLDCGMHRTDCRDLIGKRLWVVVPKWNPNTVEVSPSPNDWSNTRKLRSGSFLVKGVVPDKTIGHNFFVALPDGSTGYASDSSFIFLSEFDPVAAEKARREECERRGQPKIGMSPAEATGTCWGKPRRVVKVTTAGGVKEQFVYGSGDILEFENDKLSAILESSGR